MILKYKASKMTHVYPSGTNKLNTMYKHIESSIHSINNPPFQLLFLKAGKVECTKLNVI